MILDRAFSSTSCRFALPRALGTPQPMRRHPRFARLARLRMPPPTMYTRRHYVLVVSSLRACLFFCVFFIAGSCINRYNPHRSKWRGSRTSGSASSGPSGMRVKTLPATSCVFVCVWCRYDSRCHADHAKQSFVLTARCVRLGHDARR